MTVIPQHMQALAGANETRLAVAELRRYVATLRAREAAEYVADVIEHDHAHRHIGSVRMLALLTAVRRVGPDRAHRCLRAAGVLNEDKRLRELTERQRGAVADQLRMWGSVNAR